MELKQLTVFVTVAEHLSFSRAAEELNMSQSTSSKAIRSLEEELGVTLFNRNLKQLELTLEGQVFLAEAYKILEILKNIKNPKAPLTIKVGFVPLSVLTFLPELIDAMKKELPRLNITLDTFYDNNLLLKQLQNNEVDIAFYYQTYPQEDVQSSLVFEDDIMVIQSVDSPFAHLKEITLEHIPKMRYILPPREVNPYLMDAFLANSKVLGFEPDIAYSINPHQARLALVSKGLGVMFDSESLQKLKTPNVIFTPVQEKIRNKARIFMGWKTGSSKMAIIRHFIQYFEMQKTNS